MTDGITVTATGSGTLPCDLATALLNAQAAGVTVVRSSRCMNDRILTIDTSKNAIPDSKRLIPVQAGIALMLESAS